ncbi:MAG: G5 domain-containing protein [Ardenticatenaceae bacterium]|nr:G5 domain-containing protein [Ardenticatenaceae bacterium]
MINKKATPKADERRWQKASKLIICLFLLLLAGCVQANGNGNEATAVPLTLQVDGQEFNLTTGAATVRELLAEAGVTVGDLDEVDPPLFTPLTPEMAVRVVRVSETVDVLEEIIPFERKFVRTDGLSADDPPQIVQAGQNGRKEITIRIVYRDGQEVSRIRTNEVVLAEPQDELVMIGIGANRGNVDFSGNLAIISGGTAVLMRGSTAVPETLNTGDGLDGRVFSLSPTGSHLLYTRVISEAASLAQSSGFGNSLWVISTERGAEPRELGVENVLWADWNPNRLSPQQIAYTTADPIDQPPGWEANNDLWLADVFENAGTPFNPEQFIDTYPALNGWWGGNYAWSPDGRMLAYAYANEVGLIDTFATENAFKRRQLQEFTAYNTLADWVWVPTLTWSPDGRFVAVTNHGGDDDREMEFNSWVFDIFSSLNQQLIDQTGMWGHLHWVTNPNQSSIAFLRTADPVDSLRSNYTLWLMDQDGSNARQIYPPLGENSAFPRDRQFMAWGPSGQDIAFIFDDDLFIINLETAASGSGQPAATQITADDTPASQPTWAPYGIGLFGPTPNTDPDAEPTATPNGRFLPETQE